jgi:hypothetical protein
MNAKEFWKEIFGEYPQNDSDKLAVAMMSEYADRKALHIGIVSGSASDFEEDLGKLINNYVKAGLKKPDLVKKMEWMTGNCKFS